MMNYHYHLFTIHSSLMLNITIPFLVTSPIFLLPETLVSLSHRLEQCFTDHIVPGKSLKPKVRTGATAHWCWSTRIYSNFSKCPKSHLAKNSLWIASHVWLPVTIVTSARAFQGSSFTENFSSCQLPPEFHDLNEMACVNRGTPRRWKFHEMRGLKCTVMAQLTVVNRKQTRITRVIYHDINQSK